MLSDATTDMLWLAAAAVSLACAVVLTYSIDEDSPIRGPAYVAGAVAMTLSLFQAGRHVARLYSSFASSKVQAVE